MGLDIYISVISPKHSLKQWKCLEENASEQSENVYWAKGYGNMTEEEREEAYAKSKAFAVSLGLDEDMGIPELRLSEEVTYGNNKIITHSGEFKSKAHPDHLWNLSYYRSSYNGGGFNSVMRDLGLKDLYDIFEPAWKSDGKPGESYYMQVDWDILEASTKGALAEYDRAKEAANGFKVMDVSWNMFTSLSDLPGSNVEVLKLFLKAKKSWNGDRSFGNSAYSSRDGHFFPEGITVHAVVTGRRKGVLSNREEPCTYVVYKTEEKVDYYRQCFEILLESIEFWQNYLKNHPEHKDHLVVCWSS